MSEHEARARAVYDHDEDDEPRPTGRRRRQVADWGVTEELFDGMPGRRFDRRGEDHRIPRGGADDGRRTIVITQSGPVEPPATVDEEYASREDALRAKRQHDAVWAGDEPFATDEHGPAERAGEPVDETSPAADGGFATRAGGFATRADEFAARADEFAARHDELAARHHDELAARHDDVVAGREDGIVRGGVEGRRTVKIGGRPGEFQQSPTRRRPAPTIHDRVGPRPDRIAAWACALGLLLIIIAIATASI